MKYSGLLRQLHFLHNRLIAAVLLYTLTTIFTILIGFFLLGSITDWSLFYFLGFNEWQTRAVILVIWSVMAFSLLFHRIHFFRTLPSSSADMARWCIHYAPKIELQEKITSEKNVSSSETSFLCYPDENLLSSVEFLSDSEGLYSDVSTELKNAVISRASTQMESFHWASARNLFFMSHVRGWSSIPERNCWLGVMFFLIVFLMAGWYTDPENTCIAFRRFFTPWYAPNWITSPLLQKPTLNPLKIQNAIIYIRPPKYTGKKTHLGTWSLECLSGTRVAIRAYTNYPLKKAVLYFKKGMSISGELADGNALSATWYLELLPHHHGEYHLELEDVYGRILRGQPWQITILEDSPPHTVITQPEEGSRSVTPEATITVAVSGTDDYALSSLSYRWAILPEGTPLPKKPRWSTFRIWDTDSPTLRAKTAQIRWNLNTIHVTPGQVIYLEPVAHDSAGELTSGKIVLLHSVSDTQMRRIITQRDYFIRTEYMRAFTLEQTMIQKTSLLLDSDKNISSDAIRELCTLQAEVSRILTHSKEGLPLHLNFMKRDITDMPLLCASLNLCNTSVQEVLDKLGREELPILNTTLTNLRKTVDQNRLENAAAGSPIPEIRSTLKLSLELMQKISQIMRPLSTRWDDISEKSRIQAVIQQIYDAQTSLAALTHETLPSTLGYVQGTLSAQLQNKILNLADTQSEIILNMQKISDESLRRRLYTPGVDSVYALRENRLSHSLVAQNEMLQVLKNMLDVSPVDRGTVTVSSPSRSFLILMNTLREVGHTQQLLSDAYRWMLDASLISPSQSGKMDIPRLYELTLLRMADLQHKNAQHLTQVIKDMAEEMPFIRYEISRIVSEEMSDSENHMRRFFSLKHGYDISERILQSIRKLLKTLNENFMADNTVQEGKKLNDETSDSLDKLGNPPPKDDSEDKTSWKMTPADIILLRDAQSEILEKTQSLYKRVSLSGILKDQGESTEKNRQNTTVTSEVQNISAEQLLSEISLLGARQKQLSALPLPDSFKEIITQMHQVEYLFIQHEIGPMNTSIQQEIIFQLQQLSLAQPAESSQQGDTGNNQSVLNGEISDPKQHASAEIQSGDSSAEKVQPMSASSLENLAPGVWGALPVRIRNNIRQLPQEKILPEYKEKTENYFNQLQNN